MEIYIVYNDDKQIKSLINSEIKDYHFFNFIDERTLKGKKEAWRIKGRFSAKKSPFAVIYEGEKPIKAFYTEADSNIINSLIKYLNE